MCIRPLGKATFPGALFAILSQDYLAEGNEIRYCATLENCVHCMEPRDDHGYDFLPAYF